jgi:hypothetical protein
LTEYALTVLSDLAQGSEVLAVPLLKRAEVPEEMAKALYQYVGEEMKKFITREWIGADGKQVEQITERVVEQFTDTSHYKDFLPEEYMINAARAFMQKGMLNTKLMLSTLRRGHVRSFVAQLAVLTEMPVVRVCQMLCQVNGQGLAFTCKAFDIDKQDFVSMFMLTGKIRDHGRMVEMDEIRKAVSYYNVIKKDAAQKYVKDKSKH